MADFNRSPNKFLLRGINITLPSDRLGGEWAQRLINLRSPRLGEWRQRPGLSLVSDLDAGSSAAALWGSRLSDYILSRICRIFQTADGKVYGSDNAGTTFALADSGWDSGRHTHVIARPDRAPSPYLFLAGATKKGKFGVQVASPYAAKTGWGLPVPTSPPTATLTQLAYKVVQDCEVAGDFTGVGGAVSGVDRLAAIGISYILYDTGSTGWASVSPATMTESWQEGMFVTTSANVESVVVESLYPAITNTTVAAISYDSGSAGLCTIQPTVPSAGLQRNTMLRLNGTESVRVLSVSLGLDGIPSFRCSTVGTIAVGNTITGVPSFRAYFANTHTTAETLSTKYVEFAVAASGVSSITDTISVDMSTTNVGATRPIQQDDLIHLSLLVSDYSQITEIQLQFDVDSATNDFTQNYFFKSVRPPDLQAAISQTASSLTAQQQEIQRQQIDQYRIQALEQERDQLMNNYGGGDYYNGGFQYRSSRLDEINNELGAAYTIPQGLGSVSVQGTGGASQWSEFKFPISSFQRVGSDSSRDWRDVKALRVSVNSIAAVTIGIDAIWVGGSYGLDHRLLSETQSQTTDVLGAGYNYVWRARNSSTGSRSNPSPPLRSPVYPVREGVSVVVPSTYTDAQADVVDLFRIGGTLSDYFYVATIPYTAPYTYVDTLPDDTLSRNPILEQDRFEPWAIPDKPKVGTCDVVGTSVIWKTGDTFNTAWARGTTIIINGSVYSLYSNPTSSTRMELNESAPNATSVRFEIPEPLLLGQTLPVVFGPYGTGVFGEVIFGIGDTINPGYLYWTNGNDPESTSDINNIELCPPSERLQSGGVLDGMCYVWSDRRSWRILPSFNGGQTQAGSSFYAQETSMGKGLASRWGLAIGDNLYFVSWDGIYVSKGDAVQSLTDESIAPLFRRDGGVVASGPFAGLASIDFSQELYITLTFSKDGLYFTYRGTNSANYVLYYSFQLQGWVQDQSVDMPLTFVREGTYTTDTVLAGSATGKIYTFDPAAVTDASGTFTSILQSREEDFGDSRSQKQLGDAMIDVDPAGNSITATAGFDNGSASLALSPPLTGAARTRFVRDYLATLRRSVDITLSWNSGTGVPKVYEWQPSALIKPEFTLQRATDWIRPAGGQAFWLQGMRLTADTYNSAKQIVVQYDDAQTVTNLTVTHDGEVTKAYSWTPVVVHQMRVLGSNDGVNWRVMSVEPIGKTDSEKVTSWITQTTSLGFPGFWHIRDLLVAHESSADLSFVITIDGTSTTYTIPHGSGQRIRSYFPVKARKGKYFKFTITSASPFRLYLGDCEVRAKAWGLNSGYQTLRPFGDISFDQGDGARI